MSDWVTINPQTPAKDDWVTVNPKTPETVKPVVSRLGPKPGTEQVATSRERSITERMGDAYNRATSVGGQGEIGGLIRRLDDFFNLDSRKKSADFDLNSAQVEATQDAARTQKARALRELWARMDEADPAWRENGTIVGNVARFGAELLGDTAGNANVTYLLSPGRTVAQRIGAQAGINAGLDVGVQGGEIAEGVADSYDPYRTAMNALAGALLQGTGEGASALFKKAFPELNEKAIVVQEGEFDSLEALQEAYSKAADANEQIKQETGADASNFEEIRNKFVDYAQRNFDGADIEPINVEAPKLSLEEQLAKEAEQFVANRPSEPTAEDLFDAPFDEAEGLNRFLDPNKPVIKEGDIEAPVISKQDVDIAVKEITKDWTNAPEFEIVQRADEIDDPVAAGMAQDPSVLGFVGDDGKVRIIADHLQHPDEISAVTFHEALGHRGLSQKFGKKLDKVLEGMYHSGGKFREDVDAWMERNPDAYKDDPDLVPRAVDEVLAEMSEAGPIDVKLMDRIKNFLKTTARELGITLKYTDREVRAILGMAHDAVINGKANAADNGFRYMRNRKNPKLNSWLGNSKAVDETGAPVVLYHGTSVDTDFNSFKMKDRGVWFTEDPNSASSYAIDNDSRRLVRDPDGPNPWSMKEKNTSSRVLPVYLKAENPKVFKNNELRDATYKYGGENYAKGEAALFRDLRNQGYDSIKLELEPGKNLWVALKDSSQVKSASGNSGEFSANNKDLRYMRRRNTVGDSTGAESFKVNRIGNIRTNRPSAEETLNELIEPSTKITWEETINDAAKLKLSVKEVSNLKLGLDSPKITAARDTLARQTNRVVDIATRKYQKGNIKDQFLLNQEIAKLNIAANNIAGISSELGRMMNSLKIEVATDAAMLNAIRTMQRQGVMNPDDLADAIKNVADNPEAVAKIAQDSLKPLPEDYITSLRYSAMLSGLGTPVKAIIGTMSNMMFKSVQDLAAVGIGAAKRPFTKAERLTLYEWGTRQQGMVRSLNEALAQARKSWKEGTAVNAPDRLEVGHADLPFSMITEYPKRNLAAIDGFFREVITGAEFYGLASRKALGAKISHLQKDELINIDFVRHWNGKNWNDRVIPGTKEFDELVQHYVDNPTEDMIKIATREADQQQFLSNDSWLLNMLEMGKVRKPEMSPERRLARFTINHLFPFSRNLDNVIRQALRNSPLGFFSETVRSDWRAGGARRDQAVARIAVGTTLLSIAGQMALDGLATGTGSSDYDRAQQDLAAGKLPNAVLIDGEWVPLEGFDSISVPFNTWVSAVLAYNNDEISDENFFTKGIEASKAMVKALGDASILAQLSAFTALFNTRSQNNELAVGMASSFVPAIVRQQAQWGIVGEGDRAIRDSTGDGSLSDRIIGRILTSLPETPRDYLIEKFDLSKVPQRMDVYGRPLSREGGKLEAVATIDRGMKVDDNPAILEVQRLSEDIKGVLVSPVDKEITVDGEKIKLTPEERQQYQYFAGSIILLELEQAIVDPIWKELTDDEKRQEIKLIVKESKEIAREEIFAKYYEQEEEELVDETWNTVDEGYIND